MSFNQVSFNTHTSILYSNKRVFNSLILFTTLLVFAKNTQKFLSQLISFELLMDMIGFEVWFVVWIVNSWPALVEIVVFDKGLGCDSRLYKASVKNHFEYHSFHSSHAVCNTEIYDQIYDNSNTS